MSSYSHPVFGPERRAAALAAISELAAATAPLTGYSDYDTPTMRARYVAARDAREHYSEYGTSFDAHAKQMHTS